MKKIVLLLIILGSIYSQTYDDVVYLKNGSVIRGLIIENAPNRYIKIQSGQNIFVYQMDEIEKMTKEISDSASKSIKNKTFSIQIGFGNHRSMNLIGFSKDFRIGNNASFYLTAGLGAQLIGAGFALQGNYNESGLNISAVLGANAVAPTINGNISYQWRIGNQGFISLGLVGGIIGTEEYTYDYWEDRYYNKYVEIPYLLPTLSFDYRF